MGKRVKTDSMEIHAIKEVLTTINKRVEELIIQLTGNSTYGVKGIKAELKEVKEEVHKIKLEMDDMRRAKGWISVKSLQSKVAAVILVSGNILIVVKTFVDLLTGK